MSWNWLFALSAITVTGMGFWALSSRFPGALQSPVEQASFLAQLLWLGLLGSALIVRYRSQTGHAFRDAALWVAIGAMLVLAYSFRHDAHSLADRLWAELLPGAAVVVEEGAVSFRAGNDGHFTVEAEVDGIRIRFLVDTGATSVVLSPADARRLGFDLDKLRYTQAARTANGIVYGAPVRLQQIRTGTISVRDIGASVNGTEMERSLLGMSFLNRLSAYEVRDGVLKFWP